MDAPFAVGDSLYVVDQAFGYELRLERAVIRQVGPATIRISDPVGDDRRAGLGFNCRTRFRTEDAVQMFARTPREAWAKCHAQLDTEIRQTEARLVRLRRQLKVAHAKATKEKT